MDIYSNIKTIENNMVDAYSATRSEKDIDKKIELYKKALTCAIALKKVCFENNYIDYYSGMWMHCHNSRTPDFNYVDKLWDEYNKLLKKKGADNH